jgi:hypothetical protein
MEIEENLPFEKKIPSFGTRDSFKKRPSRRLSKRYNKKTIGSS